MVPETDQEREAKATDLASHQADRAVERAYKRGRREQEVDGRLDDHDRHFKALNGSIERSARAQEATNRELAGVKQGVLDVKGKIETGETVASALAKTAASRRDLWLAVGAIAAIILAAVLSALLSTGHV